MKRLFDLVRIRAVLLSVFMFAIVCSCLVFFQNFTSSEAVVANSVDAPLTTPGDQRTVAKPPFPPNRTATCPALKTTRHIFGEVSTLTPHGKLHTSEEGNLDTERIKNALSACAAGIQNNTNATVGLVLEADSTPEGSAYLSGPITLPPNVSLIIAENVTLFASRQALVYDNPQVVEAPAGQTGSQTVHCGQIGPTEAACNPFITLSSGSGIYGPGTIDGQGGQPIIFPSSSSSGWTASAYCQSSAMPSGFPTTEMSWWDIPNCSAVANTNKLYSKTATQNNPVLTFVTGEPTALVPNITYYDVGLENSPRSHISISGATGVTIWGVRINTPSDSNMSSYGMGLTHNTDGIDLQYSTNVTVTGSWINDGDDHIAVGAVHGPSSNITISHNHLFGGHGISIGSMTEDGISNMIVSFNNIDGGANSLAALSGLQIKSDAGHGGLVQNILYKHNCIKNAAHPIRLMTTYEGKTATTHIPSYQNITFTENWITNDLSKGGEITFDGSGSNTPLTVTLGNVYTDNATIANGETSNSADAILKIVGAGINFSPHATKGNTTLSLLVDGKTIEPGAYTPNLSLTQNPGCTAEFAQMETSPPFPILWPPLD